MKNTTLLAALLATAFSAFGQMPDTTYTTIGQTSEAMEKTRFIDRYDHVFGTQQPTKFLLKWNTLALLPVVTQGSDEGVVVVSGQSIFEQQRLLDLRAEAKIAPMLSLQVAGAYFRRSPSVYSRGVQGFDLRAEPRWYYDMARRIRTGKSANNLTGNYIGLEGRNYWVDNGLYRSVEATSLSLRFGMQRRLWHYGFFDLSYGMGHQSSQYQYSFPGSPLQKYTDRSFFGEARVALGFALGGRKNKAEAGADGQLCEVFRCFQEDHRQLKMDLLRTAQFGDNRLTLNPRVSWEQKIGHSPFSVEVEGEVALNAVRSFNKPGEKQTLWTYRAGANVQPRYYFLQHRQMARGKSGNNLNGPFTGVTLGYIWSDYGNFNTVNTNYENLYTAPHLGIQYRLFRKGFIQYKFGVMSSDIKLGRDPNAALSWYSDLKIGMIF